MTPERARDLVENALLYLAETDGYPRKDLQDFVYNIIEDLYREEDHALSIQAALLLKLTAAAREKGDLTQEERETLDNWIIEHDH